MKLYDDISMKNQITSIYLGEVEAGQQKEIRVYLFNDTDGYFKDLKYSFPKLPRTETLEIIDAPIYIDPHSAKPLTIRWKPSANFRKALELQLDITGKEVFIAKKGLV